MVNIFKLLNCLPGGVHLDAAVDGDVVLRVEAGVAAVVDVVVVAAVDVAVYCGDQSGAVFVVFRRGGGRREAPRLPELALGLRTLE